MIQVGCPFEVGETFAVELDALELEVSANVRPIEREGLAELAESIARVGQLAPILVYWTGERFRLAAGFRRVLAMGSHRQRYGFVAVLARRVDADAADLVRLVENFERENPSTFDTCRYLYELNAGLNGRQKRPASEIAEAIGRSTHYVHNLIRFYRVLPDAVRSAWAADGDRRFTFRVLNELSKLADSGDDAALRARVEEILTVEAAPVDSSQVRAPLQRGMTRARVATLLRALETAGEERIQGDERASVAVALLRAISGEAQASIAEQTVQGLLADLGVQIGRGG